MHFLCLFKLLTAADFVMAVDLAALELELERELQRYDDSLSSHSFNFTVPIQSPDAAAVFRSDARKPNSKYSPVCTPLQPQYTSSMHSTRSLVVTSSGSIYYPPESGEENTVPVNSNAKPAYSAAYHASRRKFDFSPDKAGDQGGDDELLQDRLHDLRLAQSAVHADSRSFKASMAEHEQRFAAFKQDQRQLRRENVQLRTRLEELERQGQGQGQGEGSEAGVGSVGGMCSRSAETAAAGARKGGGDPAAASGHTQAPTTLQLRYARLESEVAQLSVAKEDYRLALEAEITAGAQRDAALRRAIARQRVALEQMQAAALKLKSAAEQEARRAAVATQQRDAVRVAYEKIKARLTGTHGQTTTRVT